MESYLIRIYRRNGDTPEVVGTLHAVDQQYTSKPFHNLQELMVLLTDKGITKLRGRKAKPGKGE